jgi:RNA polymerase sigma factor (sigma-70 family)
MAIERSPAMAVEADGQPEDALVVQQVLAGNTALFELLMRRYNERIYRAARSIVRDEHEAEDVMQQAYVNAYAHLRQFNGSARFSTWLTRIAINEALARIRRQRRSEPFGGPDDVLRRAALEGLGGHATADAHITSPRPADGDAADARPYAPPQLRTHSRHGRIAAEQRAHHLCLREPRRAHRWREPRGGEDRPAGTAGTSTH